MIMKDLVEKVEVGKNKVKENINGKILKISKIS